MTFLYCCTFEHAYRAVAWQWFGQIRYNINNDVYDYMRLLIIIIIIIIIVVVSSGVRLVETCYGYYKTESFYHSHLPNNSFSLVDIL
jgi:hypothetical protein